MKLTLTKSTTFCRFENGLQETWWTGFTQPLFYKLLGRNGYFFPPSLMRQQQTVEIQKSLKSSHPFLSMDGPDYSTVEIRIFPLPFHKNEEKKRVKKKKEKRKSQTQPLVSKIQIPSNVPKTPFFPFKTPQQQQQHVKINFFFPISSSISPHLSTNHKP